MNDYCIRTFLLLLPLNLAFAASTFYCPTNHTYVSVGMSPEEVVAACGKPTRKEESNEPFTQKIPMMQLMYDSQGASNAFYGVWTLPVGVTTGSGLEVDVINNKVYAVRVNGESSQAFSLCKGTPIVKGDPVSKVYSACGNPSTLNNTYINQEVPNATFPETWIYDFPYQDVLKLTFVNGKLQHIN